MDELTKLFSPSCWVPGKTRDEVMNEFFADIQNAYTSLKDDTSIPRKEDISYSEGESQKIDIWGEVKDKLFIFIHGGYWAAGSRKDCVTPAQCALSNGFAFASIGYRLAIGGFTIDDCVRDVVNGLKFLLSEFPNVTTFVVGGHSAGAHLAFHAVTQIRDPRIQGLILFSGCYFLNELVETEIGTEIRYALLCFLRISRLLLLHAMLPIANVTQ
uniref:Abhydrolase_3 domain-containing protein n=1 Tax=Caenorhabditis japonica TaxID=281687 RepID=A0A8R1I1B7_CAEJA